MIKKTTCAYCGKEFETKSTIKLYCSRKCAVTMHNKMRIRKREENDFQKAIERIKEKKEHPEKKEYKNELARINAEARAHGMTYGKYVALKKI